MAALRICACCWAAGSTAGCLEGWRSLPGALVTTRVGRAAGLGLLWGAYAASSPVWVPVVGLHNLERRVRGRPCVDPLFVFTDSRRFMVGR